MTQPKSREALYQAIDAGTLELNDLAQAIARTPEDWTPDELHWLCKEKLLDGQPPRWLSLCRHQAEKPLTGGDSWYGHPQGLARLLDAYPDFPDPGRNQTRALQWLRAVLAAARAAASLRKDVAPRGSPEALEEQVSAACTAVGLARDHPLRESAYGLAREFLAGQQGRAAVATERMVALGLGVVDEGERRRGYAYKLRVDLLPNGRGRLYPVPELTLPEQDPHFIDGLSAVRSYLTRVGLWSQDQDMRWSLKPFNEEATMSLSGASASGAFALTAGRLLAGGASTWPPELQGLEELDLARVAVSAEITESGTLRPVRGLWKKISGEVAELANTGAVDLLVVARGQRGVPQETAMPVRRAANLGGAVAVVRQHTGPWGRALRWASGLEVLTPKTVGGEGLSWEFHYQVLPLFQHIPDDELPHEERQQEQAHERDMDARTDPRSRHRTRPISAWHEAARRARSGRERAYGPKVTVQRVFTDYQKVLRDAAPKLARTAGPVARLVVVGDPGAGKTTLMGYLVRESLAGRLGRRDGVPQVPVLVRLREWESRHRNRDLPALLARMVRARLPTKQGRGQAAASAAQWADWLARGRVLLLFDGLDEVGPSFAGKLQAVLSDDHWKQCPALITCRTVSFEQHQRLGQGLPVFELSPLERPQWAAFVRAYPAGKHTAYDPEALLERLRANPGLQPLAANPRTLDLLCFVHQDAAEPLPETRGGLYARAVRRLLEWGREEPRRPITYPEARQFDIPDLARWLGWVALERMAAEAGRLDFEAKEFSTALKAAFKREGLDAHERPSARQVLDDLRHNTGLLQGNPKEGYYAFLHTTVQEYLAAQALADHLNDPDRGWDENLPLAALGKKHCTARGFVCAKAWDPAFSETIILLGGLLEDPTPLLEMLLDERTHTGERCAVAQQTICDNAPAFERQRPCRHWSCYCPNERVVRTVSAFCF